MKKVPKYIQYWLDSFLLIDLAFFIALLYSCLTDGTSCFENAMFGVALFYMPWAFLLNILTASTLTNPASEVMITALFGLLVHIVLAFLCAKLFKKRKVARWFAFLGALVLSLGLPILSFALLAKLGYIS